MAIFITAIFAYYFEFHAILLCNPGADVYTAKNISQDETG